MSQTVTILLSAYNGERYLKEQIESIRRQSFVHFNIIVRDDGSNDRTQKILSEYQEQNILKWYGGDNLKPAKSFWNLIELAPESEYYAFSDQDDYWMPDKLSTAIEALKIYNDVPAMYCSAYQLTDENLNPIRTDLHKPTIDIYHAVIDNIATGCSVVFNARLMALLRSYTPQYYFMHDEWLYKLCVAIGGVVVYDPIPHIYYRQHGLNVIGGIKDKWYQRAANRIIKLFMQSDHHRYRTVEEIIKGYSALIPDNNRNILEMCLLGNIFPNNLRLAFTPGFYRNSTFSQILKIFFLFLLKKF